MTTTRPRRHRAGGQPRPLACAVGLAVAFAVAAARAHAEPLPKEACDTLGEEHARLIAAGAKDWMAQGAAQARARLAPAQLEQIRRFIEVDEQLAFRCGLFRARFALPRDVEDPEPEAKEKEQKPEAAKAKPKPRPKAQPASGTREGAEAAGRPAPARRKRPPADDAYRPPAAPAPQN